MNKKCTKCLNTKPTSEFYVKKNRATLSSHCKVCIREKSKEDYHSNIVARKETQRKYRERLGKNWNPKQSYKVKSQDPNWTAKDKIRHGIKRSFQRRGFTKNSRTFEILGASYEVVIKHLEDSFEANYGIPREYISSFDLHIDHIIPVSSAKDYNEFLKLNHYKNLQYLTAEDNLKKGGKIEYIR